MKFNTALVIICICSASSTLAFAPGAGRTHTKKMPCLFQGTSASASASASSCSFVASAGSAGSSALYSSAGDLPSDVNDNMEDVDDEEQEIVDNIIDTSTVVIDELVELPAGAAPIIQARNDLISISNALTSESPTGLFITLPSDRAKFMKAVARLEAIGPTTSDESEPLMLGEWTLVATSRKTAFGTSSSSSANGNKKKKMSLPKLNPKIKNSIKVTQRIRSTEDESLNTINRIDNVIEFDNTMTKLLPSFLNPLQIDQSKLILVHKAKVESFVPFRTKLALQSIVLNIAGQSKNLPLGLDLDPDGADVFGLNIPSLSEWMNAGDFDTTYVDQDVRVSRGTIGLVEMTRVFVRQGSNLMEYNQDVDMDIEVDADADADVQTIEEKQLDSIAKAIGGVANSIGELMNDVTTVVEKDLEYMKEDVEVTRQEIKDVVEEDVNEIVEAVSKVKSAIIGDEEAEAAIDDAIDDGVSVVTDFEKDVEETIRGDVDSLKSAVEEDVEKVEDAVEEVTDALEEITDIVLEEESADVTSDDITVDADADTDADDDLTNAKISKDKKVSKDKKDSKKNKK